MVNKWYLVGKINSSSYRLKVLKELKDSPKTPSELEKSLKIKISHISRSLKELSDINLIKCLNPELRKNKLFSITKKGREMLKELSKL